jgi:16S rRNA processing protein RimM
MVAGKVEHVGIADVVVGRMGKAHGLHGEVSVELRTDEPERRFAEGAVLSTQTPSGAAPHGPGRPATLTVRAARWHHTRLLVSFHEVADRSSAEALRGLVLLTTVDPSEVPDDPEEFYDHQLVGLRVETTGGDAVGTVAEVLHSAGQDLLAIRSTAGSEVLVPFVQALVPVVDVRGGRLVVEDRPGLLDTSLLDGEA